MPSRPSLYPNDKKIKLFLYVLRQFFVYFVSLGEVVGNQLLSLEFSEIDLFLFRLTCGRGRPVSAQLRVSYQNITPSLQNLTSRIESFCVDGSGCSLYWRLPGEECNAELQQRCSIDPLAAGFCCCRDVVLRSPGAACLETDLQERMRRACEANSIFLLGQVWGRVLHTLDE